MRYRWLGRTGIQVSEIALGTMVFGWKTPPAVAHEIIDRALDRGINLVDTSNSYGRGRSEEILGDALARNGRRHDTILATKGRYHRDDAGVNAPVNARRQIMRQCEASLRRLRTDYIDLYQIHRPEPAVPIEETLRALDDLTRAGKIIYAGSSNFAAWRLVDAHWVAKASNLRGFVSVQAGYNLLDRSIEREILPATAQYGLGVIVWSPLAEGILTGKYRRGAPLPADSRYATVDKPGMYGERLTAPVFDAVEALGRFAAEKGVTLSAFCLAWLINRPGITSVLAGPSTLAQLDDHLASRDVVLSSAELVQIEGVVGPQSTISPYCIHL